MKPDLHLGITPWRLGEAMDAQTLCRQAEQAEAWGFDSFFLPESHFVGHTPVPDPMLLLAAISARTRHIRLGTTSYLLPIRNPVLAAEQVAALDQLSEGRLILGLGRGYQPGMLDVFGVTNADKRARFDDHLETMLAAWRGETIGAAEHALTLTPRPLQSPHPPLWVAAFGPRAIAQVGRLGLPYLASPMETLAELETNHGLHRDALQEHGHPDANAVIAMRTVFISEQEEALTRVRELLAQAPAGGLRKGAPPAPESWCLLGTPGSVRTQIEDYRQRLGLTHLVAVRPRVRGIAAADLENSFAALAELHGAGSCRGRC